MRKILVLLLCVALLFTVGCNKQTTSTDTPTNSGVTSESTSSKTTVTFASPARTFNKAEATPRTLQNTYFCLTKEKKLNIIYIGGSVTVGTGGTKGGWRTATTEWFKSEFPDAEITDFNAAIGGTSSMWGLFRTERDVIERSPDLVFIEYAINDLSLTGGQSASFVDAMVRKINTALPYTDIVLVFTTNQGIYGKDSQNLMAHRDVAKYYGLPYINVGKKLVEVIENEGSTWDTYMSDWSHPNNEGYRVYTDEVIKNLKVLFDEGKSLSAKIAHKINETPYTTNTPSKVQVIWAEDIPHDENWKLDTTVNEYMRYYSAIVAREKGCTITLQFEGSMVGYVGYSKKNAAVEVSIDGANEKTITPESDNYTEVLLYDDLAPGKHTLTITYKGPAYCIIGALLIG